MSERARAILVEEMSFTGPVRVKQVEEAQQKILETIRRLEAAGEIVIPKRGTEDKLV
jgi:flagellar motor switch protein FliG